MTKKEIASIFQGKKVSIMGLGHLGNPRFSNVFACLPPQETPVSRPLPNPTPVSI